MKSLVAVLFCSVLLLGCDQAELDREVGQWLKFHRASFDPVADSGLQPRSIESAEAQLGMLLFFSTTLSGTNDVACVSCHHPYLGGDDDMPLSVGVRATNNKVLGYGRQSADGTPLVPRNTPTTFNSALWTRTIFYDGRIERLNSHKEAQALITTPDERYGDVDPRAKTLVQAQAGFPVTSRQEMRDFYQDSASNERLRASLVERLVADVERDKAANPDAITWRELFLQFYPQDADKPLLEILDFARVQDFLAAYEETQVFVNNPWRRYVAGEHKAISAKAKRGAILFFKPASEGGAGCVACHKGSMFTDEQFHVLAIPHAGITGKDAQGDDPGRFFRTGIFDDRYAFRTPSLWNVTETAPYGHSGTMPTLAAMIRHHLDPEQSNASFNYDALENIQAGLKHPRAEEFNARAREHLRKQREQGKSLLPQIQLNETQISELVAFLETLTDPCVKDQQCLQKWVPINPKVNPGNSLLMPTEVRGFSL